MEQRPIQDGVEWRVINVLTVNMTGSFLLFLPISIFEAANKSGLRTILVLHLRLLRQ